MSLRLRFPRLPWLCCRGSIASLIRAITRGTIACLWLTIPGAVSFSSRAAEEAPAFVLPKNPVAAAYMLGRLSNEQLVKVSRSEFVYVALLQRPGLEKKYRLEALEGLAKARQTDAPTELLKALKEIDAKGEEYEPVVHELAAILVRTSRPVLAGKKTELDELSAVTLPSTRQAGFAGMVIAEGKVDSVWKAVEGAPEKLGDLILGLSLIPDPKLLGDLYPRLEGLANGDGNPQPRQAAIATLSQIPGNETNAFKTLSTLFLKGVEQPAVVASLHRIPKRFWARDEAATLSPQIVSYLQSVPTANRTETAFTDAVQFATELASILPADRKTEVDRFLRTLGVRVIVLRALREQMLYDKQQIVVEAGKLVEIVLENDDVMPHNLVIVTPGSVEEIGVAAEKMSPEPDQQGRQHVPDSPKVLHATRMLGPGERARLSFTAPAEPGDYHYVCTFPGHWRRMVGRMAVVRDIEAHLANQPAIAEPTFTEWKLADLVPDLEAMSKDRNLVVGKGLFLTLACAQCHKLGAEGYAYGPDLTDVFKRYGNSRSIVLREILEPSASITNRYRNILFTLKNGDSVTGTVVKEDGDTVTIQSGPADTLIQDLKKSDLQSRASQELSPMPAGLLNSLQKEQILDLLAYVEANGVVSPVPHKHP